MSKAWQDSCASQSGRSRLECDRAIAVGVSAALSSRWLRDTADKSATELLHKQIPFESTADLPKSKARDGRRPAD